MSGTRTMTSSPINMPLQVTLSDHSDQEEAVNGGRDAGDHEQGGAVINMLNVGIFAVAYDLLKVTQENSPKEAVDRKTGKE